ncbi:alpha/beta hydrolase [Kutzneria viridogrisea]|uniref:Alpha/beta hydrolase fold protein n=2 Tax=Kutzneria TaxID=43356 RepID=W5W1F0_9PSEU|nr:alpha/beta fold hydrolase [Kutzneria albida]AHH94376.1 alpha/beta hydrolase fold protein [Kutzneria albida DSM 43870]MBA8930042.1 pimeloyl-ACP methyl ester carboxylesterase [Kutzneria viridogrisea]
MSPWDQAARSRFTTEDGTVLHVVDEGPADAPVTLVLVHAWTLDHTTWDRVADGLGGSVRVLRYDHRGHGGSAPSPEGTARIEQLADDLAELLADRVPTGRVVLAGHSIGGMTIMALAERHPELVADRVSAVAFVATSCGDLRTLRLGLPRPVAALVMRGEQVVNRKLAKLPHKVMLRRTAGIRPGVRWLLFGADPDWRDVASAAEQFGRCHPQTLVGLRTSLAEHERRQALAAYRDVPVLVLAGGADRLTTVPHAKVIARELPDAELVIYPGAGHMVPVERGTEVTARLAALVERVAKR